MAAGGRNMLSYQKKKKKTKTQVGYLTGEYGAI